MPEANPAKLRRRTQDKVSRKRAIRGPFLPAENPQRMQKSPGVWEVKLQLGQVING
jgi:hypothetical protein